MFMSVLKTKTEGVSGKKETHFEIQVKWEKGHK